MLLTYFLPSAGAPSRAISLLAIVLGIGWGLPLVLRVSQADPPPTTPPATAVQPGVAVYQEHCLRCHGENGQGTKEIPAPLHGEFSLAQLAAYIDETMPHDDPSQVTGAAAHQVAQYIHGAFYSTVARDRNRPARVELSRLTVRQYQNTVADLIAHCRNQPPIPDTLRGLRGEYFCGRDFKDNARVYEQIDPEVRFDFKIEGPDPERFEPNRFAIRWTGSIVPPETGTYEFIVRTEHAVRLAVNTPWHAPSLLDAWVKSGDNTEYRGRIFLLGGRRYPLRLEFSKANQGIDNKENESVAEASIALLWQPPHGTVQLVPQRCLIPTDSPPIFVLQTPFPPDDRSIGYDRGASVSKEWLAASTAASIETADYVLEHIEELSHVKRGAPQRLTKLTAWATSFAERAFRQPLSADLHALLIDRPFATMPDADAALRRSILLTLSSTRFLFPDASAASKTAAEPASDGFAIAARLALGLWDSIPDEPLWQAAQENRLANAEQVAQQAERMINDRRVRAKVQDFLFAWLRVDHGPEIVKDAQRFPAFSQQIATDMRTSLALFLDDVVWGPGSDFRRLFTDDEIYLNGNLAALYNFALPSDAPFQRVRLDGGSRGGVLSHPYMMSVLSYAGSTSPIHRGVFLARSVLGNVLRPPPDAVSPLAPHLHKNLTTRERVALQTSSVACQTCHTLINPLGFALEGFDALGRQQQTEQWGDETKAVETSGSYQPREGAEVTFKNARELADYVATSRDAQEAFVQALFHALVKQPIRAWGPETLENLRQSFVAHDYNIRHLLVAIMQLAVLPPESVPRTNAQAHAP